MSNASRIVRRIPGAVAGRPRDVVTVDDRGGVRTGPAGAWWSNLGARPCDRAGFALELPAGRMRAWNVAGVAVEAALFVGAHVVAGVSWATLAVVLAGMFAVVASVVLALPALARDARRRHVAVLAAHDALRAAEHAVDVLRAEVAAQVAQGDVTTSATPVPAPECVAA